MRFCISLLFMLSLANVCLGQKKKVFVFGKNTMLYPKVVSILENATKNDSLVFAKVTDFNKRIKVDTIHNFINVYYDAKIISTLENPTPEQDNLQWKNDIEAFYATIRDHDLYVVVEIRENEQFYQVIINKDQSIENRVTIDSSATDSLQYNQSLRIIQDKTKDHLFYIDKNKDDILATLDYNIRSIFKEVNHRPVSILTIDNQENKPPLTRNLGKEIVLDARKSFDLDDKDRLTYTWFVRDAATDSLLSYPVFDHQPIQTVKARGKGQLHLGLIISDGIHSDTSSTHIQIINEFHEPIATRNYFALNQLTAFPRRKKKHTSIVIDFPILEQLDRIEEAKVWAKIDQKFSKNRSISTNKSIVQMQRDTSINNFYTTGHLYKSEIPNLRKNKDSKRYLYEYKYFITDANNNLILDTSSIKLQEIFIGLLQFEPTIRLYNFSDDNINFKYRSILTSSINLSVNLFKIDKFLVSVDCTPLLLSALGYNKSQNDSDEVLKTTYAGFTLYYGAQKRLSKINYKNIETNRYSNSLIQPYLTVGVHWIKAKGQEVFQSDTRDVHRRFELVEIGLGLSRQIFSASTIRLKVSSLYSPESNGFKVGYAKSVITALSLSLSTSI